MNQIINNLLEEFTSINQTNFTKDDVIKIITSHLITDELPILESNGITIYPERYSIIQDGKEITLPKKEFQLLYYLIQNKNSVIKRNEIMNNVWGSISNALDRTIDVHIRKLRAKLNLICIQTYKGFGYAWVDK